MLHSKLKKSLAHTYLIKISYSSYDTKFILTSKTEKYPDDFLKEFCEDMIRGIADTCIDKLKEVAKVSELKKVGISEVRKEDFENYYQVEYLGFISQYDLPYLIINVPEEQKEKVQVPAGSSDSSL